MGRMGLLENVDHGAVVKCSGLDPYIFDDIIDRFYKTCNLDIHNPR